jgi:hypothetical protein
VIVFELASLVEQPHGVCHVLEWVSCPSVTLLRDTIESLTEREIRELIVDGPRTTKRRSAEHQPSRGAGLPRPRHAEDADGDARGADRGLP